MLIWTAPLGVAIAPDSTKAYVTSADTYAMNVATNSNFVIDNFVNTLVKLLVAGRVPQQTICNSTMPGGKEVGGL